MPNRVVGDIFTDLAIKGKGGVERILYKVTFLFVLSLFRCRYLSQRMRNGNAFIDDLEVTGMGGWGVLIMVCINFDFQWEACKACVREKGTANAYNVRTHLTVCQSSIRSHDSIVNSLNELNLKPDSPIHMHIYFNM